MNLHVPTCTTVTSLYISKNSVFISPHKHSNTIISKRNAHCSRAREKKKTQLKSTETSRFPSRHATVLAYKSCSLGKAPDKPHNFQSNQAGLQIIFLHTYSETNLPPQTCGRGHNLCIVKTRRMLAFPNKLRMWTVFSLVQSVKYSLDWLVYTMIGYLFPLLENPLMPIVMFMQGQFNVCKLCIWTNAFPNISPLLRWLDWIS